MSGWQQDALRDLAGTERQVPPRGRDDRPTTAVSRPPADASKSPVAAPVPVQPAVPASPADPPTDPPIDPRRATHRRAAGPAVAVRQPLPRRLAELLSGAVTTSRDSRESLDVHERLTAAVPSGRRIVVLGLRSGVGSTTVAALVSAAVAGRRSEPVLVVDAARSGTHAPLAGRFGVDPRKTLAELAADPPDITSRDELRDHLTAVGRDVWLLPGAHGIPSLPLSPRGPAPDAHTYRAAVSGLSRFFDIVVTDLGSDADLQAGADLITGAHALCVVCDGSQSGITYAETLIRGLRDAGPQSWAGRTVILANAVDEDTSLTLGTRRAARRATRARVPIVVLRHDPALRGPISSGIASLSRHTHRAALRVGAALLDTAVPDVGIAPSPSRVATP